MAGPVRIKRDGLIGSTSDDYRNGVVAFMEQRSPVFKGE